MHTTTETYNSTWPPKRATTLISAAEPGPLAPKALVAASEPELPWEAVSSVCSLSGGRWRDRQDLHNRGRASIPCSIIVPRGEKLPV